jgi:hypothetical protein
MRRCVWSRNLKNEDPGTRWAPASEEKKKRIIKSEQIASVKSEIHNAVEEQDRRAI